MTTAMEPLIDTASAERFLRVMIPEWGWLLQRIESDGGYVRFPPMFSQWIKDLKIENYPLLYQDERHIGLAMLHACLSKDEIAELNQTLLTSSPASRGEYISEVISDFDGLLGSIVIPKTPREVAAAQAIFNSLSKEEQEQSTRFWQYSLMALMSGFYQALSIAVTGEKLSSLVKFAMAGDDKAFCKAIQIDKRILFAIPYFTDRYNRGQLEGQREFTELVGAHLARPPYRGKIRHKQLYLAFAFLEQAKLLPLLKHREILDLCNGAGLDAYANRIEDVKNLTKRLAEYRNFQQQGQFLSTPP